jgi:hypothetical protein
MKCSAQRETVRGFVSIVSPFIIASAILFAGLTRGTAPASGASGPQTMSSDLSTEEEVQLSKIATKVFGLPSDLEGRFLGAFGGIRAIDNSTLVIGLVDSERDEGARLRQYVGAIADESRGTLGRSTTFEFESTNVSYQRRLEVRQIILDRNAMNGDLAGFAIDSVGLDAIGLVIESAELVGPIQGTLKDLFPEIAFTFVKPASSYATVGRFADSAPWNGGDALAFALFGSAHLRCTSGPGAHNASGARFLLSAGHCGSLTYFNTSFGNPLLNNPVGSTSASIFADGYPDVQIISTNSSRFFWEGPGNGVRRTTQAGVDPIVGYSVCGQGMTTAAWGGTNCGVITQVNRSDTPVIDASSGVTHVAGAFIWDGSASLNGDSGGYISLSTIYGYGAVGTITSSNPNGSPPYSVGTPIAFHNFIWGLALNTPSNP